MEREAYAKLLSDVQQATKTYKLGAISTISGISTRYLRKIRTGTANVSVEILKRIERTPAFGPLLNFEHKLTYTRFPPYVAKAGFPYTPFAGPLTMRAKK